MCPIPMLLARASLILCLVVGTRQLSITEFKVPNTLESGENAELRCRYDPAGEPENSFIVKWWWTPFNTSEDKFLLYQRIASHPGAVIRHNVEIQDNDTVVLLKTIPADSGVYECEVSTMSESSEEVRQHQELIIFTKGTGLNLTMSEVPDGPDDDTEEDVLIECKAEDVAPEPDIVLSIDKKEIDINEYITGPDDDGFYDVVANVTLNKNAVEEKEVHCELFYVSKNLVHPQYFVAEVYDPSGALINTEAPENATEADTTTDSLQNPSGDSSQCRLSLAFVFAMGLLTQVFALL